MSKSTATKSNLAESKKVISHRKLRTMAEGIFAQLKTDGCASNDILHVSSELIDLVTHQIKISADSTAK